MRSDILMMLKKAGGFVSGEAIAAKLNVSRTAVWKHINELRGSGYIIDSLPKSGYILKESPDLMLPCEIDAAIETKFIGRNVVWRTVLPSTNDLAKKLAADGAADGTVVIAEEQAAGRGRLSRAWYSPRSKGLWFSLILRPDFFLPSDAPKCTLLAAAAVIRAMKKADLHAGIKWPNDILYENKKLVGILTEMSAQMDGIDYIVVGIGINVNIGEAEFPAEVEKIATSLSIMKGEKISRIKFFADVLREFENLYLSVKENGFAPILAEWKKYSVTLGSDVEVIGVNERFFGRAEDIDETGALLVKTDSGLKKVLAGDVSIRNRRQEKGEKRAAGF